MIREKILNYENKSILELLIIFKGHLSRKRINQLKLMAVLALFSSLSEVLSLALIVPFLSILANPEYLWANEIVRKTSFFFNILNADDLLLPLTLLFGFSSLFSGFIRVVYIYLNGRICAGIGSEISCKAFSRTLYQSYSFHLNENSSAIINPCSFK